MTYPWTVLWLNGEQASYNAEDAAQGETKPKDENAKPMEQLEGLVKHYQSAVSNLERELQEARAHPVVAEDVAAKKHLLAAVEQERFAKEAVEKGTPTWPS